MNRVIEVNEKLAYAVVEPGVSYFDLYRHLQKIGSKLWIDCAAPGWGGVIGNLMERGAGYTPYGEHFLTLCGMQVVLPDGTVIETGTGAQRGRSAFHTYKYGRGPSIDGLFTQSNFGVVTRIGIHLMPQPPGYRPYMVALPEEDDIEQFMDIIRPLKLAMLIPNAATCVELHWEAAMEVSRSEFYDGPAPLPASVRRRIMDRIGCGNWNFYGALYGSEQEMDNTWKVLHDRFSQIRGAQFYFEKDKGKQPAFSYRAKLMRGVPNMTEFNTLNWIANGAHVGFGPIIPVDGRIALEQYRYVRDAANRLGFDYFGEFIVGWRDMHHIFMPTFSRGDAAQKRKMFELINLLIDEAAKRSQGVYRTHLDFMDRVAATYSWNEGALAQLNRKLKGVFDPNGFLAPGKSGIWPVNNSSGSRV
jgi:4-cresol dehydrogenase (hydroxylating) flavoprotein subunit